MFKSCENKGFQITFDNGWTISVQWGKGNYCDRRDYSMFSMATEDGVVECKNAEVAVWDADGVWLPLQDSGDDVIGWQTPDEVAALITRVSAFPKGSDILDEADTILE